MEEEKLFEMAKEFHSRNNKLTLDRYNELEKELNIVVTKRINGELTNEEALKIHQSLLKERNEAIIFIDNEEDFRKFSNLLANFDGVPKDFMLKQIEHEIEHSIPYKKAGINYSFGWFNFTEPTENPLIKEKRFKPFCTPFGKKYNSLSIFERDKLNYNSLKSVSKPSLSDLKIITELKKRWGDKIEQ